MPQEIRFSPIFALNLGIRRGVAENLDADVGRGPSLAEVCPNCRPNSQETCYNVKQFYVFKIELLAGGAVVGEFDICARDLADLGQRSETSRRRNTLHIDTSLVSSRIKTAAY